MSSEKIKCRICSAEISQDELLAHLGKAHNFDVMRYMKFWKTWRGLAWTFVVFSVGVVLGILVRGLL